MTRKLTMGVCILASVLLSLYAMIYLLKETDPERLICGNILLSLMIFAFFIWLFELARTRDERKRKIKEHKERRENEIRETNSRRD